MLQVRSLEQERGRLDGRLQVLTKELETVTHMHDPQSTEDSAGSSEGDTAKAGSAASKSGRVLKGKSLFSSQLVAAGLQRAGLLEACVQLLDLHQHIQ